MKQELINNAMSNLQKKQKEHNYVADLNLEKALEDEIFKNLYSKYKKLIIENAKKSTIGEEYNQSEQNEIEVNLQNRLKELKIGDITHKPYCKICNDTMNFNGKMCKCLKSEISNILIKQSGFKNLKSFKDAKFDVFENPEEMKQIYEKMQSWCESNFNKNLIFMTGNTGVGKTHLMECMANRLIENGKIVYLTSAFSINQNFVQYQNYQDKPNAIDKFLSCEVLFIDDLGSETIRKNLTIENLYIIINERKLRNLPTVITSNLELFDIREIYGERIYSRIIDRDTSITIKIGGSDLRSKQKNK